MDLLVGALIFLPFLTLIIAIHELGHLTFAKRFGMKVTEQPAARATFFTTYL